MIEPLWPMATICFEIPTCQLPRVEPQAKLPCDILHIAPALGASTVSPLPTIFQPPAEAMPPAKSRPATTLTTEMTRDFMTRRRP